MSLALDAARARFETASPRPDARSGAGRHFPRGLIAAAFLAYVLVLAAAWWALTALVPDQLTIHLAGHALHLHQVHDKVLGNAALMLVLLPSALWLECLAVGWENSSARALLSPTGSMKTDIMFFVLHPAHVLG